MNTAYIYEYWGRTEIGRKMIESDRVSESDLLFLMPNNVKKMHGLPMTRVTAKRKSHYKRIRKRMILSFSLFEMIEEIIEDILPQTYALERAQHQLERLPGRLQTRCLLRERIY